MVSINKTKLLLLKNTGNNEVEEPIIPDPEIPSETVICEYSTPGTYTVVIPESGDYEIYCIAPGGAESCGYNGLYGQYVGVE